MKNGWNSVFVGLVEQQVAMELAIGRQNGVEDQPQHGLGLLDLLKGVGRAADGLQFGAQQFPEGSPRRFLRRQAGRKPAEQLVDVVQEPGIRRARGEVQVSEDLLGDGGNVLARLLAIHEAPHCPRASPLS